MRSPQSRAEERLDAKWFGPHGLRSGFSAREKTFEAAQAFLDAFDRSGVRKAQIAGRAESFSGHQCNVGLLQQQLGKLGASFGVCVPVFSEMRRNVGKGIERPARP